MSNYSEVIIARNIHVTIQFLHSVLFREKKMCMCIKQLFKPFLKAITFVSVKIHIMALNKIFSYKFGQQNKTANCKLKQS